MPTNIDETTIIENKVVSLKEEMGSLSVTTEIKKSELENLDTSIALKKEQYAEIAGTLENAMRDIQTINSNIEKTKTVNEEIAVLEGKKKEVLALIESLTKDAEARALTIEELVQKYAERVAVQEAELKASKTDIDKNNLVNDLLKQENIVLAEELEAKKAEVAEATSTLEEVRSLVAQTKVTEAGLAEKILSDKAKAEAEIESAKAKADVIAADQVRALEAREGAVSIKEQSLEQKANQLRDVKKFLEEVRGKVIGITI